MIFLDLLLNFCVIVAAGYVVNRYIKNRKDD